VHGLKLLEGYRGIVQCAACAMLIGLGQAAISQREVRQFRSRHPDRPVTPIVDDAMPQNLPPALRYELAPDGTITDRPVTVLGPICVTAATGRG
jgi:hypothetical protein